MYYIHCNDKEKGILHKLTKVAVLLVNFQQWELTRKCIESLLLSRGVEILPVLVDNASTGPVPPWVSEVPGMIFRRSDRNLGFSGGNNLAFSLFDHEEYPWTFLLNNDTTISSDSVSLLVELLRSKGQIGITTPPIFYADNADRIWSAGGSLDRRRMIFRQNVFPSRDSLPDGPVRTEFASGCAMMMATSLFEDLGGLREDLFLYHEDSYLCLECRRRGKEIYLHPNAEVLHHVSASMCGLISPVPVYFSHRNRYIIAKHELTRSELALFHYYYLSVTILKTPYFLIRGGFPLVRSLWRATLDGIGGRTEIPSGVLNG
jgi:GT2 family glycosyltransferase